MVKKHFGFLLIAVAIVSIPPSAYGWLRTYGRGEGYSVQQIAGGGYIAVGENAGGLGDLLLIKTDSQGDTLWTRTYGEEELITDRGNCIRQTTDGGYIIVGYTGAFGGVDSLWLLKTDENGDTLWTRKYGGIYSSQGNCLQQTDDGGYIITGFVDIGGPEWSNLWLLKTDSTGGILWTYTYGGSESDGGYCVRQTSDSGYIVVGFKSDNHGYRNPWLLKTDSLGDTLWTRIYEDSLDSEGQCVQETSDGGYIIVGYKDVMPGIGYIWLLKTNEDGDKQWERIYSNAGVVFGYQYYVQQTTDGGYIITGTVMFLMPPTQEQIVLLKTDSQGYESWTRYYGEEVGEDWGYCVQQTIDGGYIITGRLKAGEDPSINFCLIKTDTNGDIDAVSEQPPVTPVTHLSDWQVTSIGPKIVLRYFDRPDGFHASIFDASGRKVDELHSTGASGTITWGNGHRPGVYFIRVKDGFEGSEISRVVIIH